MKNNGISNKSVSLKVASLISLLIFIISTTAYGVTCYVKLDNRCEKVEEKIEGGLSDQSELDNRLTEIEMNYIEIRTKLASIESMLLELKKDWQEVRNTYH